MKHITKPLIMIAAKLVEEARAANTKESLEFVDCVERLNKETKEDVMVMARLHLICGNCGCPDEWEWNHEPGEIDDGEVMSDEDVFIYCRNCGTLHSLNSKAVRRRG